DNPAKIASVMKISRKTLRIVKENIIFALGVKVLVLILGALGIASMWAAVFADVGVAVIAILNSMRALKVDKM
ncbi:MAG: heavy metal translocating P-type ATPase, partial [Lachnospiraceae bacterium]|nr:heavy metal translocating P-type ATPase [Lachnospiraceae bacterium]